MSSRSGAILFDGLPCGFKTRVPVKESCRAGRIFAAAAFRTDTGASFLSAVCKAWIAAPLRNAVLLTFADVRVFIDTSLRACARTAAVFDDALREIEVRFVFEAIMQVYSHRYSSVSPVGIYMRPSGTTSSLRARGNQDAAGPSSLDAASRAVGACGAFAGRR